MLHRGPRVDLLSGRWVFLPMRLWWLARGLVRWLFWAWLAWGVSLRLVLWTEFRGICRRRFGFLVGGKWEGLCATWWRLYGRIIVATLYYSPREEGRRVIWKNWYFWIFLWCLFMFVFWWLVTPIWLHQLLEYRNITICKSWRPPHTQAPYLPVLPLSFSKNNYKERSSWSKRYQLYTQTHIVSKEIGKQCMKEASMLKLCKHAHIVTMHSCYFDQGFFCIEM